MLPSGVAPINTAMNTKDLGGGHYLTGSDVPKDVTQISFKIMQFVNDKSARSKAVARISDTYGKTLFGFNTTNIRAVAALGIEDLQQLIGKTLTCMIVMQPNPQTTIPTRSLYAIAIS